MDLHGIHPESGRKEIRCSDCGHVYLIAQGQRSSRCQVCGNIEFLPEGATAPQKTEAAAPALERWKALSEEIVSRRVLPRLQNEGAALLPAKAQPDLALFQVVPDGLRVEKIRFRYQVEWQLWAMLVKNFHDPVFHSAYITSAMTGLALHRAGERYREHRSVMAAIPDESWQADVADLMLSRIEALAALSMEREGGGGLRLMDRLRVLPLDSRVVKLGWVVMGIALAVRLLRWV